MQHMTEEGNVKVRFEAQEIITTTQVNNKTHLIKLVVLQNTTCVVLQP